MIKKGDSANVRSHDSTPSTAMWNGNLHTLAAVICMHIIRARKNPHIHPYTQRVEIYKRRSRLCNCERFLIYCICFSLEFAAKTKKKVM